MIYCTKLTPETFTDSRGQIDTFYPDEPIVEYNLIQTNDAEYRGFHYHPHFDEYMTVANGNCVFYEFDDDGAQVSATILNIGDTVYIPKGIAHGYNALHDFTFVSLLTKRWHDSKPPIIKVIPNESI